MFNVSFGGNVRGYALTKHIGNANAREISEAMSDGIKEGAKIIGSKKIHLPLGHKMTGAQLERSNPGCFNSGTKLIKESEKANVNHFLNKIYGLTLDSNLGDLRDALTSKTKTRTMNIDGKDVFDFVPTILK